MTTCNFRVFLLVVVVLSCISVGTGTAFYKILTKDKFNQEVVDQASIASKCHLDNLNTIAELQRKQRNRERERQEELNSTISRREEFFETSFQNQEKRQSFETTIAVIAVASMIVLLGFGALYLYIKPRA